MSRLNNQYQSGLGQFRCGFGERCNNGNIYYNTMFSAKNKYYKNLLTSDCSRSPLHPAKRNYFKDLWLPNFTCTIKRAFQCANRLVLINRPSGSGQCGRIDIKLRLLHLILLRFPWRVCLFLESCCSSNFHPDGRLWSREIINKFSRK